MHDRKMTQPWRKSAVFTESGLSKLAQYSTVLSARAKGIWRCRDPEWSGAHTDAPADGRKWPKSFIFMQIPVFSWTNHEHVLH